jgi:hypothetical protein
MMRYFIVALLMSILAEFNSRHANADDFADRLARQYIETAFKENAGVIKFAASPRIAFVCVEKFCESVVRNIREILPEGTSSEVGIGIPDNSEILIFIESMSGHASTKFLERLPQSYTGEATMATWGEANCAVTQFILGDEVKKLVIAVKQEDGDFNNINCIIWELTRGSGGQIDGSFAKYSKQLQNMKAQTYYIYRLNVNFFFRVHWSPNLKPGTSKEDAVRFVAERIR